MRGAQITDGDLLFEPAAECERWPTASASSGCSMRSGAPRETTCASTWSVGRRRCCSDVATTIDVGLVMRPEEDTLLREIPGLKEALAVNVELASPTYRRAVEEAFGP